MTKNWGLIISEADKSCLKNNITEVKKATIIIGYEKLRDILGENFLNKQSNSIAQLLYNNFAPWSLLKNADFGQKLAMLNSMKNFKEIKDDLLLDIFEKSFGAEAVVEVAGDFLKKGLAVDLIKKSKKQKERTPDFKVKLDNKWINFEITTFRTWPDEFLKITRFVSELSVRINPICQKHARFVEVNFNGMIRENAQACVDRIICKVLEMVQSPEESEIVINDARIKILKKEDDYGLPYIHSIGIPIDEMKAISRKLVKKLERKQLPQGEYGILLIFTISPFLPDFQLLSERLFEIVNTEPNLSAAVIQHISHQRLNLPADNDKFKIIHSTEHDNIYNLYSIVISNCNCSNTLDFSDIKKLF